MSKLPSNYLTNIVQRELYRDTHIPFGLRNLRFTVTLNVWSMLMKSDVDKDAIVRVYIFSKILNDNLPQGHCLGKVCEDILVKLS